MTDKRFDIAPTERLVTNHVGTHAYGDYTATLHHHVGTNNYTARYHGTGGHRRATLNKAGDGHAVSAFTLQMKKWVAAEEAFNRRARKA